MVLIKPGLLSFPEESFKEKPKRGNGIDIHGLKKVGFYLTY